MTDRLIRLMRIITLIQAKPGILARELAERCGTSERTIYRDMDALSAMHIPISHRGHGKGYAFIGNFALYPMDWSDEEAEAFYRFGDSIDTLSPMLPDGFRTAYEKVVAAWYKLRMERDERMESARREGGVRQERGAFASGSRPLPAELITAVSAKRSVQADYCASGTEEKEIVIDPYVVFQLENRFHLIGYCHASGLVRIFDLDGLTITQTLKREFTERRFDRRELALREGVADEEALYVACTVRFRERALSRLEEELVFPRPERMEEENGCFRYRVPVEELESFVRWLAGFGDGAELLEPLYLREAFRLHLERWLSLYR